MIVKKITDFGRNAVSLENDQIRTVIDALGGMMPEFSLKRGQVGSMPTGFPIFVASLANRTTPLSMQIFGKKNCST
jgi:hypothetical protein